MPVEERFLIFEDTETTGLTPGRDEVIEVASILTDLDMHEISRFHKKIRNASKATVPFVLIAGEEDRSAGAVSFRYRNGEQKNGVPVEDAVAEIVAAVQNRVQV